MHQIRVSCFALLLCCSIAYAENDNSTTIDFSLTASKDKVKTVLDSTIVLECTVKFNQMTPSDISIVFGWLKRNEALEQNSRYKIMKSEDGLSTRLEIKSIEKNDYGIYTCTAGTDSRAEKHSANIKLVFGRETQSLARYVREAWPGLEENVREVEFNRNVEETKEKIGMLKRMLSAFLSIFSGSPATHSHNSTFIVCFCSLLFLARSIF